MNILFQDSNKQEALDNQAILHQDQIKEITDNVDLKIIDKDTNKLLGFVISNSPIFILSMQCEPCILEIFQTFIKYKSQETMIIYYRGDVYPVDINRDFLYAYNNLDQEKYLLEKRVDYEQHFGITPSDVTALYSLSSANNKKAIDILNWLNSIRSLYFDKVQAMNDAKYYDYEYNSCGEIPHSLQEVFSEIPAPIKPTQIKYLYAINETWQSHQRQKELVIIWDDFIKSDDIFSMKKADIKDEIGYDVILINNYSGMIKISYKVNFINSEYNRIQMQALLSKNWNEVTDSISFAYTRSYKYGQNGAVTCPGILLNVTDGDEIRLHTKIAYNSSKFGYTKKVSTIWRQSNILIETI